MSNIRDTARDYSEAVSAGDGTSAPSAITRASHPLAGEGSSDAGTCDVFLPETAAAVVNGRRRLLPGTFWTEARIARLREAWVSTDPYISSRDLALELGTTKNAVVARAHRMGLPDRNRMARPNLTEVYGGRIREMAAGGLTQIEIAARLTLSRNTINGICRALGIKTDPGAVRFAVAESNRRRAGEKRGPRAAEPMAERRVRNPMLTPAQQAQVDRHKAAHWRPAALKGLPPVTRDEADALVREWLARNKPTVCAPAVVVEPSNAGARWK
jgi:hypothetical protein